MPTPNPSPNPRRALPSVDALIRAPELAGVATPDGHADLVAAARQALAEARERIAAGGAATGRAELAARVAALVAERHTPMPRPVINATGVIINTNLGRAPLSAGALAAMQAVGAGYAALEYDLEAGTRGSRHALAAAALRDLTGAEDALVVNNAAAAVLLILAALLESERRDVIISRGELVEIGGGFRIPDVLRQSGARLVEVGTTNRTRAADYAAALSPATALILRVHASNFRIIGFTESPDRAALAALAHAHGIPLVDDLGSGCLLDVTPFGLTPEPTPRDALAAGADVVCFSGDKLLGGPQAGIIVGRGAVVARLARHPLLRALRVDKVTLAGLAATLQSYQSGAALADIPIWRMIALRAADLATRAAQCTAELAARGVAASVSPGESTIGGGALPGATLPTWHVALAAANFGDLDALARRLRLGRPPVVARVARDHLLLDLRTVPPEDDPALVAAVAQAAGA